MAGFRTRPSGSWAASVPPLHDDVTIFAGLSARASRQALVCPALRRARQASSRVWAERGRPCPGLGPGRPDVPSRDVPSPDAPSRDVPSPDGPSRHVPFHRVAFQDVPSGDVLRSHDPANGPDGLPSPDAILRGGEKSRRDGRRVRTGAGVGCRPVPGPRYRCRRPRRRYRDRPRPPHRHRSATAGRPLRPPRAALPPPLRRPGSGQPLAGLARW